MSKSKFDLTVIVPVSRMSGKLDLLKEWILLAQKKPIFVVVVHDLRDEETELELVSFLNSLPEEKVEFISGKFGSPGVTRNQAKDFIHTNWVSYWDSDDFPNLESVLAAIKQSKNDDEILIGGFETKDFKKGILRTEVLLTDWKWSVANNPGLWRMIFRREILQELQFSDLLMGEDQLFIAELDIFSRKVRIFQDIFYTYQIMFDQQATRSLESLKDLKRCLMYFSETISAYADLNKEYYQIMYLKQIITTIKYLPLGDKFFALGKLNDFSEKNGLLATLRILLRIKRGN